MKISKLLPTVCVFAVCASFASVYAQDNAAQAAAREALMKQMGQPADVAPQTPPVAPEPVTPPAIPSAAPVIVPNTQPPMAAAQPAPTAPGALSPDDEAKARAALLQQMGTTPPKQSVTSPASIPMAAPVVSKKATPAIAGEIPIIAPPLPISMSKEQQLQALLVQYKADQITPEQYHIQRAAILAQP